MGQIIFKEGSKELKALREACASDKYGTIREMQEDAFPKFKLTTVRNAINAQGVKFVKKKIEHRQNFTRSRAGEPDQRQEDADVWEYQKHKAKTYIRKFDNEGKFEYDFGNVWCGIGIFSDQHFGNAGVDYTLAEEHAKIITSTPNMYIMMAGDVVDNFIKMNIQSALVNKDTSPKTELKLFRHYLRFFEDENGEMTDNILAVVAGNHDRRSKEVSGLDCLNPLMEQNKLWYAPSEVRLTANVGKNTYKIAMRHQYRFNSAFNKNHTVKRWYDEGDNPFDVGIVAHNHNPNIEEFTKHGEMRLGIRPGTYKMADTWAKEKGYPKAPCIMPVVVLSPDKKVVKGFSDVKTASEFITGMNNK